jgi:hypothetical protein
MKYTVVTTPVADHQLADIWLKAATPQQVADSFNRIESLPKNEPHSHGRQHPDVWRVLTVAPMLVTFRVSDDDRIVTIMSVYYRP